MKNKMMAEILSVLLLVFFVHTAVSIFIRIQSLKNMLGFYTTNTNSFAWLIFAANALVALMLFLPRTRLIGFLATIIYALALTVTVYWTPGYPHHFGGIINSIATGKQYYFYAFLILISLLGIWMCRYRNPAQEKKEQNIIVFT